MAKKVKTIMQDEKICFKCPYPNYAVEPHHIFFGTANRKISDRDGCIVWLCRYHHNEIHRDHEQDLKLKRECQLKWMEYYNKTIEDFIKRYGKNYL